MSVIFPNSSSIDFGHVAAPIKALVSRTWTAWIRNDLDSNYGNLAVIWAGGAANVACDFYVHKILGAIIVEINRTTAYGQWKATFDPAIGAWHHLAFSYDNSSVANDPKIYIDGSPASVFEVNTPVGTPDPENTSHLYIGGLSTDGDQSGLTIKDFRIYNRILSDSEILAIKNEDIATTKVINSSGLLFHLPGNCAKGLTHATFPGATLVAANQLIDRIGCVCGVPAGSPKGE